MYKYSIYYYCFLLNMVITIQQIFGNQLIFIRILFLLQLSRRFLPIQK